jgi:cyclase
MLRKRIIPCLLIDNARLIKTTKFNNPKYIGDPINAIKIFNEKEVDELILIDISASKLNKEPNFKLLEQISSECFMPLCYGGGITKLSQADKLFEIGIEKICIQTEFIKNPIFIKELSEKYGSQSIVISVDLKKNIFGNQKIYSSILNKYMNTSIENYFSKIKEYGAGEILVTNINLEGKMEGLDLELINKIQKITNLPIIFNGGIGNIKHIEDGFKSGADALAAGSFFVYSGPHKAVLISYPKLIF